jgi:hypothetical protein
VSEYLSVDTSEPVKLVDVVVTIPTQLADALISQMDVMREAGIDLPDTHACGLIVTADAALTDGLHQALGTLGFPEVAHRITGQARDLAIACYMPVEVEDGR